MGRYLFANACKPIKAAGAAGADAVTFQIHIVEAESLLEAPSPSRVAEGVPRFRRLGSKKRRAEAPAEFDEGAFRLVRTGRYLR